jgi:hypothetical protein
MVVGQLAPKALLPTTPGRAQSLLLEAQSPEASKANVEEKSSRLPPKKTTLRGDFHHHPEAGAQLGPCAYRLKKDLSISRSTAQRRNSKRASPQRPQTCLLLTGVTEMRRTKNHGATNNELQPRPRFAGVEVLPSAVSVHRIPSWLVAC